MVGSSYGMIVPTLRKLNQTSVNSWDVYIMQSPQNLVTLALPLRKSRTH